MRDPRPRRSLPPTARRNQPRLFAQGSTPLSSPRVCASLASALRRAASAARRGSGSV